MNLFNRFISAVKLSLRRVCSWFINPIDKLKDIELPARAQLTTIEERYKYPESRSPYVKSLFTAYIQNKYKTLGEFKFQLEKARRIESNLRFRI